MSITQAQLITNKADSPNWLEIAKKYFEYDFSIIPVDGQKRPLFKWTPYQTQIATIEEIEKWSKYGNFAGFAVVTGSISNVLVLDIDNGADTKGLELPLTPTVNTPHNGQHYYFKYPKAKTIKNYTSIRPKIDIRAEGGIAILPPTTLSDGGTYEWVNDLSTPLAEIPHWLLKDLEDKPISSQTTKDRLKSVPKGQRNESATSIAGTLLNLLPEDEWETTGWQLLQAWNSTNQELLSIKELRTLFESIKSREKESREENKDKTIALQLVEEVEKSQAVLFHDEKKDGYVALSGDGRELLRITSKLFKRWLFRCAWEKLGRLPSGEIINNTIQALEGKAVFDGPEHQLYVRIAEHDNALWYDLGDGSVVRIVKEGWAVIEKPPILFRRFSHQKPQVHPKREGNLTDLYSFVNLSNEEEKLLFLTYTVAAFIPDFPHPLLVLHGPQGAGKTTPLKLLHSLVDPSELKTLSAPDSLREFVQTASHHYLFFLDNLSSLPGWLSDALARACTGDGFSKRELYSDDDDIIYSFQRPICLNGINLVVQKADLLDRSLILGLERISKEKRRDEQEFWKTFEEEKPYLLGAIFDVVAKAIGIYPTIFLSSYPRMADFTLWGCAIAQALGYTKQEFLNAYYHNIDKQNEEAIEASPVGIALLGFVEDNDFWEGTASELLSELERLTIKLKIDTRSRDWPKSASSLSRKIQLIQSNLADKGIMVVRDEKARPRRLTINKVSENIVETDISSETRQSEANPTLFDNSSNNINTDSDRQIEANPTLPTTPTTSPQSVEKVEIPYQLVNSNLTTGGGETHEN